LQAGTYTARVHRHTDEIGALAEAIVAYARHRFELDPVPLDGPRTPDELTALAGRTITEDGIGGPEALRVFEEVLSRACISVDHPRFLSFIPAAPTEAAMLFDLVVGASSIYAGSWLEGAGAVYAENQALRWLADLAGLPPAAGGVFVQGGTLGNLSALVAARHAARERGALTGRAKLATTAGAHSSIAAAARVMDVDVVEVEPDPEGRLRGAALAAALDLAGAGVFAVIATAGTTNLGIVDRLDEVADVCADRGLWLHVDGAYGGAALAAPSTRARFAGIERADSFIVDPHKWLFAPFDSCALLYRDPEVARRAHTQEAGYLEPLQQDGSWNPSDYAINLSRRARGLPFWFSLATHGTRAYSEAIEQTLAVARFAASEIRRRQSLELLHEPDLSVVVFRRSGWTTADYYDWSDRLMRANFAFVTPSTHGGETVARFAIVNPRTTEGDISAILDTMA
jgi:glutamate/tyrosine decarboxylase-like PLP-dependent enzyme